RVVDRLVSRPVKVNTRKRLDDVGDGVLGEQHAAQHALLGGEILRRHPVGPRWRGVDLDGVRTGEVGDAHDRTLPSRVDRSVVVCLPRPTDTPPLLRRQPLTHTTPTHTTPCRPGADMAPGRGREGTVRPMLSVTTVRHTQGLWIAWG